MHYAGWQVESKQVAKLYRLRLVRCQGAASLRSEGKLRDQSEQKSLCKSKEWRA